MSISLEALAMSGANFLEVGFDMNEWEQMESEVPPHLLADEEEENEEEEEEKKIEWNKVDHENRMKKEAIKKVEDFFSSSWSDCGFSTGHKARLDNCFRKLDGYLEIVLDEHYNLESTRKGDDDEEDLVDALIRLSNQENGLMSPLSKEQIKAMLMNTFLGGAGTSSIVIV
ncbi:PREDICTED: cytochrome P450 71B36 [Erythranthe guttata]|uniref:cytochrome P450 71B36 n=1 Tax=Erythranthe guttata TaxID=4155 RepID=UPI00064D94B1|nr:PREDICTED: cytochrome P450 71B36 [Erythranthe guttata]|eukprot:XP_012853294.1 PREDICTED: cytochrome P450 71B36 [Erythranthe guttata]